VKSKLEVILKLTPGPDLKKLFCPVGLLCCAKFGLFAHCTMSKKGNKYSTKWTLCFREIFNGAI